MGEKKMSYLYNGNSYTGKTVSIDMAPGFQYKKMPSEYESHHEDGDKTVLSPQWEFLCW